MSVISASIAIQDRVSGSLNRITASLYNNVSAWDAVDRASDVAFNPGSVQAMANELYNYSSRVEQLESDLVNANRRLEQMEQQTREAANSAKLLKNAFTAVKGIMTGMAIKSIIQTSDSLVQTTSRINMMNDGLQTTDELMDMVYKSAQDARGSFSDMADVVARFGNNVGIGENSIFSSSEEVVAFSNLVQKQMTIAGASTTEASNAMLQLSQALGSGALRGDELNSIFEQSPNLIRTIAKYIQDNEDVAKSMADIVGVSYEEMSTNAMGHIRDLASEGAISAGLVKNAMFSASKDINDQFNSMPMTWGQVWQKIQNTALMAFKPVLTKINELTKSEKFQRFVNNITNALSKLSKVAMKIFDLVVTVANVIADNWSFISPILWGVVAALAAYYAKLLITKGLEIASAIAKGVMAAATWATTSATWAATTAQYGLNGAMYACPLVWIIGLIVALIAVLVKVCGWIAKVTGAAESGIGIITGALAAAFAFIGNLFITFHNIVAEVGAIVWNLFATLANFIGNVFTHPVAAVVGLVVGMGDAILGVVEGALEALSWITFGLADFTDDISRIRKSMNSWYDDTFEYTTFVEKVDADDLKKEAIDYGDAFDAGAAWGDGIADKIDGLFSLEEAGIDDAYTDTGAGSLLDTTNLIADNTSDEVDISNENLKYLRDIAETEAINKFTTAEIKVDMKNNNTINNGMDLDGIIEHLTVGVQEAMTVAAEGVYA